MKTRQLKRDDLDAVYQLCKRNLKFDQLSRELILELVFDDPNAEKRMNLIALDGDKPIGFISGVIRKTDKKKPRAFINLFAVEKKYRRQHVMTKLFDKAEAAVKSAGINKVKLFGAAPWYVVPGLDPRYTEAACMIEKRGYNRFGEVSDMSCNLSKADLSTRQREQALKSKNMIFSRMTADDLKETFDFLKKTFSINWGIQAATSLERNPISSHIARLDGKVVAYAAYDTNCPDYGAFGPMGTSPACRGLGAGEILLKRCLRDLKNQGKKEAHISWVGSAMSFYTNKVGAVIERVFWDYDKKL